MFLQCDFWILWNCMHFAFSTEKKEEKKREKTTTSMPECVFTIRGDPVDDTNRLLLLLLYCRCCCTSIKKGIAFATQKRREKKQAAYNRYESKRFISRHSITNYFSRLFPSHIYSEAAAAHTHSQCVYTSGVFFFFLVLSVFISCCTQRVANFSLFFHIS